MTLHLAFEKNPHPNDIQVLGDGIMGYATEQKGFRSLDFYWKEQTQGKRQVWLAFYKEQLAGYVNLTWNSQYQPFRKQRIPEIMDLNAAFGMNVKVIL